MSMIPCCRALMCPPHQGFAIMHDPFPRPAPRLPQPPGVPTVQALLDEGRVIHLEQHKGMHAEYMKLEKALGVAASECITSPPRKDANNLYDFSYLLKQADDPTLISRCHTSCLS
jgi:hypothetical protein